MSETAARPFTAATFNRYLAEHVLAGSRCPACAAVYLPPRAICPRCRGDALEWVALSGRATLVAFTSIFVAPSALVAQGFDRRNPYVSGIVELEEGPRISARILGLDGTQPEFSWIGLPLLVTFLERSVGAGKSVALAFTVS